MERLKPYSAFVKGLAAMAAIVLLGYGVSAWATGALTGAAGGGTAVSVSSGTIDTVTNLAQEGGVAITLNAGAATTGTRRVAEATDSQLSAGVGATGDAAATAGSTGSLTAKARLMTTLLDTISTAIASILTAVQLIDDDQTGSSVQHHISVGTTEDETEIKATAGRLMWMNATNTNAAARYLRCANLTAANNTPGTSAVFFGLAIPGATTGAGFAQGSFGPSGLAFGTALTCWVVTGVAETDVAEVAANEINWNIGFK